MENLLIVGSSLWLDDEQICLCKCPESSRHQAGSREATVCLNKKKNKKHVSIHYDLVIENVVAYYPNMI